ncbi:MAG TPA: SET domain-containing protein-lysine N-methyltransferase [Steroidobacteraceae bacterium]|nr:SET domain-containing protein-lysine N-methyltransferase [Steroidobacteraceae bacterium]
MTRSRKVSSAAKSTPHAASPLVAVYDSPIHGSGVRAAVPIKKGSRVIEYLGERVSHPEADRRYDLKGADDGHTFLFIAGPRVVIDAGVNGNEARFINHSCAPNCETVIENSRVFIEAIRSIQPGDELGYDYQLTWESTDDPVELENYACRCGAKRCRGTMLDKQPQDLKAKLEAVAKKRAAARRKKAAAKKAAGKKPAGKKPPGKKAPGKKAPGKKAVGKNAKRQPRKQK